MRVRIHKDIAKLVDKSRRGKRTANEEVNMALAVHYSSMDHWKKMKRISKKIAATLPKAPYRPEDLA